MKQRWISLAFLMILLASPAIAAFSSFQAAVPSGSLCPANDGTSGAPVATIQHPTLLSGYTSGNTIHALGCNVAGVDYAVGVPSAVSLTDWQSISQAGVSVNTGTGEIFVSQTNTLTGIDFSLHGGSYIYTTDNINLTLTNDNFGAAPAGQTYLIHAQSTTFNLDIEDCTFGSAGGVLIGVQATGNFTFKYNWINGIQGHPIEQVSGTMTAVVKYNLFENMAQSATAHNNSMQWGAIGAGTTIDTEFNTHLQNTLGASVAGEMDQFYANNSGVLSNATIQYNTFIATGSGTISNMEHGTTSYTGTSTIKDNYFDISGLIGGGLPFYTGTMTPAQGWAAATGNVNMNTGATITPQ